MKEKLSAIEYGAKLLGRYSKTEQGFRLKMRTKNFTEKEIDTAILKLNNLGFLDDLLYAKNYANRFEHKGNFLIKTELIRKGVQLSYIEEALLQLDEEMKRAHKVASHKWSVIQAKDNKIKREKLLFFLSSRGFSYSVCKKISEDMVTSVEQAI